MNAATIVGAIRLDEGNVMREMIGRFAIVAACLASSAPALAGNAARLPIAEGVWVETQVPCERAETLFVYAGNRLGELYFSQGQLEGELIPVTSAEPVDDGFLSAIDGPDGYLRVKPLPNGRAMIRSGDEGATGRDFFSDSLVRQCPLAALPAGLRAALGAYLD